MKAKKKFFFTYFCTYLFLNIMQKFTNFRYLFYEALKTHELIFLFFFEVKFLITSKIDLSNNIEKSRSFFTLLLIVLFS